MYIENNMNQMYTSHLLHEVLTHHELPSQAHQQFHLHKSGNCMRQGHGYLQYTSNKMNIQLLQVPYKEKENAMPIQCDNFILNIANRQRQQYVYLQSVRSLKKNFNRCQEKKIRMQHNQSDDSILKKQQHEQELLIALFEVSY